MIIKEVDMNSEIMRKTFLNANDVCELCCCGKNKAYNLINSINSELKNDGFITLHGKVLASVLYQKMNMTDQLDLHKKAWEKEDHKDETGKDSKDKKDKGKR